MDRRSFLKMSPAFPAAGVTAALVLHEEGKADVTFDVSVLKVQAGDTLVLCAPGPISYDAAERLKACIQDQWPDLKALVMGDGLRLDGVIRST